ncbi:MAG: hypothetical protein V3T22_09290 [Planctomycetota bacterium]
MRILRSPALAAGLLSLLPLAGCSGGGGSGGGGDLFVLTCSLGCTNGIGGEQVFCSIVNTHRNLEISIRFSEEVDLFSVNSSSFRVVNVENGTTPTGQFFLDPLNPSKLVFRPALSFDQNGNPIFGFDPNTSYQISIPGVAQGDPPPYIQSIDGRANQSRMQCTIFTSEGIIDPVPGAPSVQMFVDVVTSVDGNGNPNGFAEDVLVIEDPELIDVWRETEITFKFNDIMNVATLVNPATGTAPFIRVEVDDDGDLSTDDRKPIEGKFTFLVDQERLETFLFFKGDLPLPSAGPGAPLNPRRIALTVPESVQDLVANAVTVDNGGGTRSFVSELSQFGEVTLPKEGGEDFLSGAGGAGSNEDGSRSGAFWGSGRLIHALGGGSGRLGDLIIPNGQVVTLNSDSQTFPLTPSDGVPSPWVADLLGNPDAIAFPDTLGNFPDTLTITDGVFEFNTIHIEPGGSLRLIGDNPVRLYSRGPARIEAGGLINLSGVTPATHDSGTLNPVQDLGFLPSGANGGRGGFGADRFDMTGNDDLFVIADPENDPVLNPGALTRGRKGQGIGRSGFTAAGTGGRRFPFRYPIFNASTWPLANNNHGVTFNVSDIFDPMGADSQCRNFQVAGSGGGGAYAIDGGDGQSVSTQPLADFPLDAPNTPPDTDGGQSSDVGLALPDENNSGYVVRKLEWQLGNLRGGSGGGGGGNHPFGTWSRGFDGPDTFDCIGFDVFFRAWHDHSGAQGGYGGGALHFVSGKSITIDGTIDTGGGGGGRARQAGPPAPGLDVDFGQFAMPGGGGSGGAIKLQSILVTLGNTAGVLDVSGGLGGSGVWNPSSGGAGGAGLVRIEDVAGVANRSELAPSILPFDPLDDSLGWVSVDAGGWTTPLERPGSITGSASCWLFPAGNFFALEFVEDEDDPNDGDPTLMGWNMDVIWEISPGNQVQIPFRGVNGIFPNSFENEFGKNIGPHLGAPAAPIVVRFQGARLAGAFDRCNLNLNDSATCLDKSSVTPWVDHPALLNDFGFAPNMVRFVVLFDGTDEVGDTPGQILSGNIRGITRLGIRVLPD